MTHDDVLYRFRLRLFALSHELGNVRAACRLLGIHPSTYYRWRKPVLGWDLDALRPRERRPPPVASTDAALAGTAHPGPGHGLSGLGAGPAGGGVAAPAVGRAPAQPARQLERAAPRGPQYARQALGAHCRLPGPARAAAPPACAHPPHRGGAAGRPDATALLPCRSTGGLPRAHLAIHRHRGRLQLHLGHAPQHPEQSRGPPHRRARPARRPRPGSSRLAARPRQHRQRRGVQQRHLHPGACPRRRPPHPYPGRSGPKATAAWSASIRPSWRSATGPPSRAPWYPASRPCAPISPVISSTTTTTARTPDDAPAVALRPRSSGLPK